MQVTLENLTKEELLKAVNTLENIVEGVFSETKSMSCDDVFVDYYEEYEDYLESDVGQL